ncbi:RIP metalloprotease RseP [Candidatus Sulfidibacterium hydrothermale]|uniref:RIP metalloprotease RseP n=1 Tax=Candidatus Sulfidibacterium hydrothermale TaxID=2875962 RepID=UPI001F0B0748|nr:RIP metalloprotease RseP [Candidatus Sulfidibacterium hydrothermale]UBM62205.1 RIP metalloprotease RseP [Candidatus Sulfidibacterium hydrothermale]
MVVLIKILQLLLSLSILVIIHEFGHFAAAKIFKTKVEKFYLFFNPWFSIFKFNYKGTEYGLGWIPLGGYVKIAGMIDESMDKEQMKKPPQPWEFRSKPAWQRLIIMLGGVTMNVVLAIIIYVGLLAHYGEEYLPTQEVNKYGIVADSLAREMGFRNGDKILTIGGKKVTDFQKIPMEIVLNEAQTATVLRDGKKVVIHFPEGSLRQLIKQKSPYFLAPRIPFVAGNFTKNSAAKKAGLEVGDTLLGINGKYLKYFDAFRQEVQKHKNQTILLIAKRGNDTLRLKVHLGSDGLLGVYPKSNLNDFFHLNQKKYNLIQAIPAGFERTWAGIGNYLKQLKLIFSPKVKAYENVGGFITIGNIFPAQWHWESFWRLTAFLSIMLAILNVLPIPALDGGHVLFLLYEIIARRKPSDKFLEYAQIVGMVILFTLLILANGNDIIKLFKH